jgi:hypothetical protein
MHQRDYEREFRARWRPNPDVLEGPKVPTFKIALFAVVQLSFSTWKASASGSALACVLDGIDASLHVGPHLA